MGKRTIEKHIKYNAEEWEIVSKKAAALGQRAGTFIREMSVQGVIKNYDMSQFNHLVMSFNRIGNELNQIAKVANSTQSVYAKDIEDMKKSFEYFHTVFIAPHKNKLTLDKGSIIEVGDDKNAKYRSTRVNGKGI